MIFSCSLAFYQFSHAWNCRLPTYLALEMDASGDFSHSHHGDVSHTHGHHGHVDVHAPPLATTFSRFFTDAPNPSKYYPRLFHVNHEFRRVTVSLDDKTPLFCVKKSVRPGKPDITLHAGSDDNAPVAAVCKFQHLSSTSKIGLGDPNAGNSVVWEELRREHSWTTPRYSFRMTLDPPGAPKNHPLISTQRRTFLWERTHYSAFSRKWKLVDARTGEIMALHGHKDTSGFTSHGEFQINIDYGRDFDTMVIITGFAAFEKEARRDAFATGAAIGAAAGAGAAAGC